jgi:hypothetical protein
MPRKAGRPFDFGNLDVLKDPEQAALYLEEILAVIPNNLFCTMRSSPIALLGSPGLNCATSQAILPKNFLTIFEDGVIDVLFARRAQYFPSRTRPPRGPQLYPWVSAPPTPVFV